MRKRSKRAQRSRLIMLALFALAAALLVFGAVRLIAHLGSYSRSATVGKEPDTQDSSGTPDDTQTPEDPDAVPRNSYQETGFYNNNGFLSYQDETYTSQIGVDVSSHQQQIDWQAVAGCGVEFAFIRIGYRGYTEGAIQEDTFFRQNLSDARSAGLKLGVYFFSQAITLDEAAEEAQFVLDTLDGAALDYPVMFDWEDIDAESRSDGMDRLLLTELALTFCDHIEAGGYRAGVYFNQRFGYEELNLKSLQRYSFWLAEYNPTPTFAYAFEFWQYSAEGTVAGIDAPVDLNVFFRKKTAQP